MSDKKEGKRLFIVHFCLLSGTGSNIYCANIAQIWKRQGHAVSVFCQDPDAGTYDWVDEFYGPKDELPKEAQKLGSIRVIVPDICGLLPLLVYDEYKGYEGKTMYTMTEFELERHINMVAKSIRAGVDMWGCDKVLANHTVLQPIIVKRALEGTTVPFDIKVHGSGIIFILKPYPRFMHYAVDGINACKNVIAGSQHIVDAVLETFPGIDFSKKMSIVPPGMDPDVFALCESIESNTKAFLEKCDAHLAKEGSNKKSRIAANVKLPEKGSPTHEFHKELVDLSETYNQRVVDVDIRERFPTIAEDEPILTYFGKFLYTKGVAEILLTFPTVVAKYPKARLILVGFGTYREHVEVFIHAMVTNNKDLFKGAAHAPDEVGQTFMESGIDIDANFKTLTVEQAKRITVTGCLDHSELGLLLPMCSISIVASRANEAFGMVSVEAMSAGVLPLCVYHSGVKDVLDKVKELEPELEELLHIPVEASGDLGASNGAALIKILPDKIFKAIDFLYPPGSSIEEQSKNRREVGKKVREVAKQTWAWDAICETLATI